MLVHLMFSEIALWVSKGANTKLAKSVFVTFMFVIPKKFLKLA